MRTLRSNDIGRYCVADLPTGQYTLTQEPLRAPFDGQTVVANLPPEGLYVDWRTLQNAAIAVATPLREPTTCETFLAGEGILEKIFGLVTGDTLAAGSLFSGVGSFAGVGSAISGSKSGSPSS